MFYKKRCLAMALLFIFLSCKEEIKTSFSEINITTNDNNIVEVNIPSANGNEGVTNLINAEIEKKVMASLHIGEPDAVNSKSVEESISSFNQEFEKFKIDFPENIQLWEAQIDGEVLFQSSEIISVALTSYINTGGVHGNLTISFLNFESETGKLIPNNELFKDIEAFKKVAKTYFEDALEEKDLIYDRIDFELPANMAYNNAGLILLYNTYEIAPYSTGIIEFTIPFKDVESLLVFNGL